MLINVLSNPTTVVSTELIENFLKVLSLHCVASPDIYKCSVDWLVLYGFAFLAKLNEGAAVLHHWCVTSCLLASFEQLTQEDLSLFDTSH